jgi:hypothetical protein
MKFASRQVKSAGRMKSLATKDEMRVALPQRIGFNGKFHQCTKVHFMMPARQCVISSCLRSSATFHARSAFHKNIKE